MMNLTPKAHTLKAAFPTKKPTYETPSKRKLDFSSLTPGGNRADVLTIEAKKGKINPTKTGSVVSTPRKLTTAAKQTKLFEFLTPKPSTPLPVAKVTEEAQPLEAKPPTLVQTGPRMLSGPATTTLNVPAYLRYAALSCAGSLALPEHFSSLEKNFKYMFHTMLYQRVMWNTFTFHQLKPAIEKTSKREFPLSQLGQFKELFPELFEFEPTKTTQNYKAIDSVFIKVPSLGLGCQPKEGLELSIYPIERIEMLCKELHTKLVNLVHTHHNAFLFNRALPIFAEPPSKWHPAFDLTSVPPVVSQPLVPAVKSVAPQVEHANFFSRNASAKPMSVLERARALLNKKPTQESLGVSVQDRKSEISRQKEDLLNRIKAKEKQRLEFERENPNLQENKVLCLHLSQLPAVARSLKAIFATIAGRRPTKPLDEVAGQIASSRVYQLSHHEVKARLNLLATVIPSYTSIKYYESSKKTFIALENPQLPLDEITSKIEAYKAEKGM